MRDDDLAVAGRPRLHTLRGEQESELALRTSVQLGLTATPKWLPPKLFYDARGSEIFNEITRLPEYYPTEAEREIILGRAGDVAAQTGARTLVELGSGSSEKTRALLDALTAHGTLRRFVPVDVSATAVAEAGEEIAADYPALAVDGVVGDFTEHLELLPGEAPRVVALLGGTIGNLPPEERGKLFRQLHQMLAPGGWLLLGADLVKDEQTLVRAYDDAAGVTAEFNRNMLQVLNNELGADFDVAAFDHVARWNPEREWMEMRLRARRAMRVRVPGAGLEVAFEAGEELLTETSAKFRREALGAELADAGIGVERFWTDVAGRYSLVIARSS